ncbi:hypothetical protein F2Q69_00012041 [Brassica cretica]|uniref:Uncharacterized protein n=1 Tax=Brassica cretica TaxID=69181 RepID=A0A8S9QMT1_BRACR|nr:hypothetical protein F2Q69_00012041 [Brassica cretica]
MIKNRGAGKIESRRVLAVRGRNTLQRRPVPEELGDGPTRAGDFTGSSKNKGGAGKIESRRVLAVRGRNTLQRRPVPEELGDGPTRAGDFTGSSKNKGTLSGSIDGKKGNALGTHGTSNRTHGDIGIVDMCVFNPVPRNPSWKWGRSGCYS